MPKTNRGIMKRALLLSLMAIFSFTQSTLAINFDSLWNKIKDNHLTVIAAFGGILGVSAVIGYKSLQKKATQRKELDEFSKKHPINFMFYLGSGTEYSTLDHKGKMEYLKQHNLGKFLKNNKSFLTDEEQRSPLLARQKEQNLLGLSPLNAEECDIALAIQRSLTDQKKPSINLKLPANYNEKEALQLALARSLEKTPTRKNTGTPVKSTPPVSGPTGKEEEEET
jgi:hypothetical protein